VDSIFKLTESKNYPYFVQGIYEYLLVGDRGGAVSRDDLSTTLEHPACELFGVNQYIRDKYRQTGNSITSPYDGICLNVFSLCHGVQYA